MDYRHFSADDFTLDESFQAWVLHPSPTTVQFWENFLEQHPEKAQAIEEARSQLLAIRFEDHPPDHLMQQRIRTSLKSHISTSASRHHAPQTRLNRLIPYLAAACFSMIILAGLRLWYTAYQPQLVYQTTNAETKEVWLPDSTLVVLNANSSVTLEDYSNGSQRAVWLKGEAFFDVIKNQERPFVVYAGSVKVLVTGTSFNVANRRQETEVVLSSGQVLLEADILPGTLKMAPGDLVTYHEVSKELRQQKVSPNQYTAWRDRIYFFQEATLQKVAEVIENYYGQEVHLAEELSELRFTAKVTMQPEVNDLLVLLSETFDLDIQTGKQQIFIKRKQSKE